MSKRVLLVDDNQAHRLLVSRALKKAAADFSLVECNNLSNAKDFLAKSHDSFVLALIDLELGDGRGTEIISILRNDPEFNQNPVVILSTSRREEDINECYSVGANLYLPKDDDPSLFTKNLLEEIFKLI